MPPPNNLPAALANHRAVAAQLLEAYPDETRESLADTIEGCTNLTEVIVAYLREARDREALAGAQHAIVERIQARQRRFMEGAVALRAAALNAMQEAGMARLPPEAMPEATVTVQQGQPKVIVTDEALLPPDMVIVSRRPSLKAIAAALKAGQTIAGAELGNSAPFITIRTA